LWAGELRHDLERLNDSHSSPGRAFVAKAEVVRRPELFVALVNGAGTDTADIKSQLDAQFAAVGYKTIHIKLSELIADFCGIDTSGLDEAVLHHISVSCLCPPYHIIRHLASLVH
jgi:hypothetical protein